MQQDEYNSTPNATQDEGQLSTRWREGDELTMVRVRFPGNNKSFPFLVGKRRFNYGQKVVAMSDRGIDLGYINSLPYQTVFKQSMLPIRSIIRVADQEDLTNQKEYIAKTGEARRRCSALVEELELDMNITHVENIQFGKKMVFYFTAPERMDFRQLIKRLVAELRVRIEIRQISVRDRASAIGSIGPCGLMTCCSSFLQRYGNVSIKMAKNQNLSLVPSKLNGVCGQIKCCASYEDESYTHKRKMLPKMNSFIQTANGDRGKVTYLHLMKESFEMLTESGRVRRYSRREFDEGKSLPEDWEFPRHFDHIVVENKVTIDSLSESSLGEEESAPLRVGIDPQ